MYIYTYTHTHFLCCVCVHFKISVRILQKLPYTHRILVEEETKDLRAGLRSISWWSNTLFQRRQWHPTPVLLPGKSCGLRSLVGCSPWGHWESDMTERLTFHFSLSSIGEGNGNPLQCSCLEDPRDGGALWAAVYGVTQSRTRLKWLGSSNTLFLCAVHQDAFISHVSFSPLGL